MEAELKYFHEHFVLCPVDKASKNIAIICKKYYIETILNECMKNTLSYCHVEDTGLDDIGNEIKEFIKDKVGLDVSTELINCLTLLCFPSFISLNFHNGLLYLMQIAQLNR